VGVGEGEADRAEAIKGGMGHEGKVKGEK
jgi:hypothetical protein